MRTRSEVQKMTNSPTLKRKTRNSHQVEVAAPSAVLSLSRNKKSKETTINRDAPPKSSCKPESKVKTPKAQKFGVDIGTPLRDDLILCSQQCDSQREVGWDCNSPGTWRQIQKTSRKEDEQDIADIVMKLMGEPEDNEETDAPQSLLELWKGSEQHLQPLATHVPDRPRRPLRRKSAKDSAFVPKDLLKNLKLVLDSCSDQSSEVGTVEVEASAQQSDQTVDKVESVNTLDASADLFASCVPVDCPQGDGKTPRPGRKTPSRGCKETRRSSSEGETSWSEDDFFEDDSLIIKATQLQCPDVQLFSSPVFGVGKRKSSGDKSDTKVVVGDRKPAGDSSAFSSMVISASSGGGKRKPSGEVAPVPKSKVSRYSFQLTVDGKKHDRPAVLNCDKSVKNSKNESVKLPIHGQFTRRTEDGLQKVQSCAGQGFEKRFIAQKPLSASSLACHRPGNTGRTNVSSFSSYSKNSTCTNSADLKSNFGATNMCSDKMVKTSTSLRSASTSSVCSISSVSTTNSLQPGAGAQLYTYTHTRNSGTPQLNKKCSLRSAGVAQSGTPYSINIPGDTGDSTNKTLQTGPGQSASRSNSFRKHNSFSEDTFFRSNAVRERSVSANTNTYQFSVNTCVGTGKLSTQNKPLIAGRNNLRRSTSFDAGITKVQNPVANATGQKLCNANVHTKPSEFNSRKTSSLKTSEGQSSKVQVSNKLEFKSDVNDSRDRHVKRLSSGFDTSLSDDILIQLSLPDEILESQTCELDSKGDHFQSRNSMMADNHGNVLSAENMQKPTTYNKVQSNRCVSGISNIGYVQDHIENIKEPQLNLKGDNEKNKHAELSSEKKPASKNPLVFKKPETTTSTEDLDDKMLFEDFSEDLFASDDDEGLTEPQILAMLDEVEFQATQQINTEHQKNSQDQLKNSQGHQSSSQGHQGSSQSHLPSSQDGLHGNSQGSYHSASSQSSSSQGHPSSQGKCSPSEIERKKQEAIRRRMMKASQKVGTQSNQCDLIRISRKTER